MNPSRDMEFIYLHGFASSPQSKKANLFKQRFMKEGWPLTVPDLEQGDFRNLSLTGQIGIVEKAIDKAQGNPCALIGSSMGGYLAALVGQRRREVVAQYLMCPGFNFLARWRKKLKTTSSENKFPPLIKVFHYRYNAEMELGTRIFEDAVGWEKIPIDRKIPTRIVHGIHDETVPLEESRNFAGTRPWVRLLELDSDHTLLSHIEWIADDCVKFILDETSRI